MRRGIGAGSLIGACAVLLLAGGADASSKARPRVSAEALKQIIENKAGSVQLVTFPDTAWSPVKVLRGDARANVKRGLNPAPEKAETAETVTFADPLARSVRVIRGDTDHAAPELSRPAHRMSLQVVTFADARDRPVSILRGSVPRAVDTELFGPASLADLDRVAFAVDGAESSHGADLRMWRLEPDGAQGPMQVTAAAATDVGGGDRFDLVENRALGRAYLARLFRRYGNWPDAISAYNWGPGNVDAWISGGRPAGKFPLMVERYRDRVLRDAALAQ